MKRMISLMLALLLVCAFAMPSAYAAGPGITYELQVDCGDGEKVETGSVVTVSFVVKNSAKHYVSVMQNEIIYDPAFFEFVPDSIEVVKSGSTAVYQTRVAGTPVIRAAYLSPSGGAFSTEEVMCTFQLRVVATDGEGWIRSDWSCAKAYNEKNKASTLRDAGDIYVAADGPCHPFKDVAEEAWYHKAVDYVYQKKLMSGVEDDVFSPNTTMTRAMLVSVLYRHSGRPAVKGENTFKDVKDGMWYTDAIIWANSTGIVSGYSETEFGTNDNITREQIAAIMYRYARMKGKDVSKQADLAAYTDAGKISGWADTAMRWANAENLITGRTNTTLVPGGSATRAEVASILMRFCNNIL